MAAKRKRARAVVIPSNPQLARHAADIRRLGRACFEDLIEIGERLIECRKLLKGEREWLAWLSAEFKWSRRTAERFISLARAKNRPKLGNVAHNLPASALFLLANAPAKIVNLVERRIEAGEPPTVREVQSLVADRPRAYARSVNLNEEWPARLITPASPELRTAQARSLVEKLQWFAGDIGCGVTPAEIAAVVPESRQSMIRDAARDIAAFMHEVARSFFQGPKLALVTGGDDDDETNKP